MSEAGAKPDNGGAKHRIGAENVGGYRSRQTGNIGAENGGISEPMTRAISEPTNVGEYRNRQTRGGVSTADIQVITRSMNND